MRVVRTGGHEEEPELLGLMARSTLLELEEMVNARRPGEKTAANLHIPAAFSTTASRSDATPASSARTSAPSGAVPASRGHQVLRAHGRAARAGRGERGGNWLAGIVTRGDLLGAEANRGAGRPGEAGRGRALTKGGRGALLTTPERPARLSWVRGAPAARRTLPATVTDE